MCSCTAVLVTIPVLAALSARPSNSVAVTVPAVLLQAPQETAGPKANLVWRARLETAEPKESPACQEHQESVAQPASLGWQEH
jgi:hypothetical protein